MHDDRALVEERLARVLTERLRPAIHAPRIPLSVRAWCAPGEPVPVAEALGATYQPFDVGGAWGAPWSTTWFDVAGRVPKEWAGRTVEAVVDLGFGSGGPGFQCEGLAYTADGEPVKGLFPRSAWLPVARPSAGGEPLRFFVEAAANPTILPPRTSLGDPRTAGDRPLYRFAAADLAVFDAPVWELVQDLEVLSQLMAELPLTEPRRFDVLRAIEDALDAVDPLDVSGSASKARACLTDTLARPAHASAHRLSAVGHAHIDSAWLWPLRETVRKVARTSTSVTALMDDFPDFRFAMSQAQQLAWLKDAHPAVFARVRRFVASGQFVPVGGMWVEADTNMPGGEALVRQLVHGKRFYAEEFGIETREVWLPDSFGYSAALPQLVALSGSRWFLTQKLSWNQTNRFPHHTFLWEGIDGTRIFTHFPPADTYGSDLSGADLAHASRNFAEKGRASRSLLPFGYGDGGGGPTREMLARARRTANLEGSPRVTLSSPAEFFAAAETEYRDPPVWSGELYLETHRGTYTTQARTKRGNRRSEHLLREAELWSATASARGLLDYPYERLDRLWRRVLLHQFHDILPGSSIAWVHQQAEQEYAEIARDLEEIIASAMRALVGAAGTKQLVFNAAPHERDGVPAFAAAEPVVIDAAPVTTAAGTDGTDGTDGTLILDNGILRVEIDRSGLVVSLLDLEVGRETVAPGERANLLQLHRDFPNRFDAWDLDAFYRNTVSDLTVAESIELIDEGGTPAVRVVRVVGSSRVEQTIRLAVGSCVLDVETDVEWHEAETLLKVGFPFDVHADRSAAEVQFGHVFRPTHTNTSWDAARFEICAHRWIHVGEAGYGMAVVNDGTYGHDVVRHSRVDGGITTTVRLSLLRGARYPDPRADEGAHHFRYGVVVGASIADAIREGYRMNLPERRIRGSRPVDPLVAVVPLPPFPTGSDPRVSDEPSGVVVEAVKLADDRSGDLVLRIYEALGGRARAQLRFSFAVAGAAETDLLERPLPQARAVSASEDDCLDVRLRPFQIVTLRVSPVRDSFRMQQHRGTGRNADSADGRGAANEEIGLTLQCACSTDGA